jgi:hypothetical protein
MPEPRQHERQPDDQRAPEWHAPPPPRDLTALPHASSPPAAMTPSPPDTVPPRRFIYRVATPLLAMVLLGIGAVASVPALRDVVLPTRSTPTIPVATTARPSPVSRPVATTLHCFTGFTLGPTDLAPVVGREAAEYAVRDGYDLPFREGRLGTLIDAHLVVLGYTRSSFGGPVSEATRAAEIRGRLAWLLSFARTPALNAPVAPVPLPPGTTAYFLYSLVDARTGGFIESCDLVGPGAETADGPLPATPVETAVRQPIDTARIAVEFPVRAAGWLPFAASDVFARINRLPDNQAEVVADYFAVGGDEVGERVRIVSTNTPPFLATSDRGGQRVTLADGLDARFDDLGKMQIVTWQGAGAWYQIVAARPREIGGPYSIEQLLKIAAALR